MTTDIPMGLLPDWAIRRLVLDSGLIAPFSEKVKDGVLSYGLESFGYTCRLGDDVRILTARSVDPKFMGPHDYQQQSAQGGVVILPPRTFAIAATVERFSFPKDVSGRVTGKSTPSRCGLLVFATPLEASWRGYVTLEISNLTDAYQRLYLGEGIAQVQFWHGEMPLHGYDGNYQDQVAGPVVAKVKGVMG